MSKQDFPSGWDEQRIREVLAHYENQSEADQSAEIEIVREAEKISAVDSGPWKRYLVALDEVTDRLERICRALEEAEVAYALVGGQAVAMWVATKDPAAVRTTKDVDILLRREDEEFLEPSRRLLESMGSTP